MPSDCVPAHRGLPADLFGDLRLGALTLVHQAPPRAWQEPGAGETAEGILSPGNISDEALTVVEGSAGNRPVALGMEAGEAGEAGTCLEGGF